uniref:HAT C-terminal dimerisation domain-containing protein n=1 Tax=Acanthochromis polyacanthus TaxID=80966 RepID=A0A3Q1EYJ4_9TELE
ISNVSALASEDVASDSLIARDVNNSDIRQEWPDCWSNDQIRYFCSQNEWLISKDKRLGCKVCSKVSFLATQTQQGLRLSHEWTTCLISAFGADKATQLLSLRKKIKEHRDSKSHMKAAEIEKMSSCNEIQKHIQDMHKTEHETSCRVFPTANKIGKHGRPFTDMPADVRLQELNGVKMGRVLHSNNTYEEKSDEIVKNRRKLCMLIDESTTISGKSVLVVCLQSAVANAEPDTIFFDLVELDGTTANDVTEKLPACLHKNGFNDHFLDECFVAFLCDGASVMLGRRAGVAAQLCARFPNLFVWHCSNHRLELAVGDVHKEVILSVRWVASSERTVKAVWESYKTLQGHFSSPASDGLNDVLTSVSFVLNLGVMYDALIELSDLSRLLQKRDMTIVKINTAQFFRSMAENIKYIKALQPDTWPEGELDIQHGDEEVLRLCDRLKVEMRRSIQGFREYKELRGSQTPEALKPLLKAVHTIAVSTSECERAFSCMNNILTDKRNSLGLTRLSNLIFLKCAFVSHAEFPPCFCAFTIKSVRGAHIRSWSGWLEHTKMKDG